MAFTANEGTQTDIYSVNNGGTEIGIVKLDIGSGTNIQDFGGTIPRINGLGTLEVGTVVIPTGTITTVVAGTQNTLGTVGNLNNGSINVLTGTVTSVTNLAGGTIQHNPVPVMTPLIQGTLGTAGGSLFGTLSAASGVGTKQYVTGLSVIGQAGTADVRILAGSAIQGTGVLGAGIVVPGGGYIRDFTTPFATGTGSELIYHFVGAGSAFIVLNYWKGA